MNRRTRVLTQDLALGGPLSTPALVSRGGLRGRSLCRVRLTGCGAPPPLVPPDRYSCFRARTAPGGRSPDAGPHSSSLGPQVGLHTVSCVCDLQGHLCSDLAEAASQLRPLGTSGATLWNDSFLS